MFCAKNWPATLLSLNYDSPFQDFGLDRLLSSVTQLYQSRFHKERLFLNQEQIQSTLSTLQEGQSDSKVDYLQKLSYILENGMTSVLEDQECRINPEHNFLQVGLFYVLANNKIWGTSFKDMKKKFVRLAAWYQKFKTQYEKVIEGCDYSSLKKKDQKAIKIKSLNRHSNNQLIQAVQASQIETVRKLLIQGADVQSIFYDQKAKKTTMIRALHAACKRGDLEMARLLDQFGCDWEAEAQDKMTPIFYAIASQNMELIRYIVQQKKVNLDHLEIQQRTPFYWACTSSSLPIVKYIYDQNIAPSASSSLGRTPLTKACYLGKVQLVKFLLGCHNIDINAGCNQGRTPLHNAVFGPKGGKQGKKFGTFNRDSPECTRILLENGAEVQKVDMDGNTALHVAASSEGVQSAKILFEYKANLNATNKFGQTSLHISSKFGNQGMLNLLLDQKPELGLLNRQGNNFMEVAIQHGQVASLKIILSRFPDKQKQLFLKVSSLCPAQRRTDIIKAIGIPPLSDHQKLSVLKGIQSRDIIQKLIPFDPILLKQALTYLLSIQQTQLAQQILLRNQLEFTLVWVQRYLLTFDDKFVFQILGIIKFELVDPQSKRNILHSLVALRRVQLILQLSSSLIPLSTLSILITSPDLNGLSPLAMAVVKKYMDICQVLNKMLKSSDYLSYNIIKAVPVQSKQKMICHRTEELVKSMLEKVPELPILKVTPLEHRPLKYIDKIEDFPSLKNQSYLGVDLQYNMEVPGLPVVALLQISTQKQDFVIDPFNFYGKLKDLLEQSFECPGIVKVMHGASTDLRILKTLDIEVVNFFDTSLYQRHVTASQNASSLASLALKYLGVKLDKMFQVAQWRIRPLLPSMIQYARKDSLTPLLLLQQWQGEPEVSEGWRQSNRSVSRWLKKGAVRKVQQILMQ